MPPADRESLKQVTRIFDKVLPFFKPHDSNAVRPLSPIENAWLIRWRSPWNIYVSVRGERCEGLGKRQQEIQDSDSSRTTATRCAP